MKLKTIISLAAALSLAACGYENLYYPPAGQKVQLSQHTYEAFQKYLQIVGSTHPGAFAVSQSGRTYYYYYCKETMCSNGYTSSYGQAAVHDCNNSGEKCYIFANNNTPNFDYDVIK